MTEEVLVLSMQVLDPEDLAWVIRDADIRPCQISASPQSSRLARVLCPRVCADFTSLGPAMLFSGSLAPGCYTLIFVTECPRPGRSFNFSLDHGDGYLGLFPPGGTLDGFTPEGYSSVTLSVPAAVLEDMVGRMFPEIPASVLRSGAGMRVGEREQQRLRVLLADAARTIRQPSGPLHGGEARRHLESELLDAFLTALRSGCGSPAARPGLRLERRMNKLRLAREFLADRLHEPVPLADLCSELGMSRRGVELLFHDPLGIGPHAFHRHQRLHGARRAFLSQPRAPGMVKQTALAWGFWHMGRFSNDYRKLFGESPSRTLAGAPPG